MAFELKSPAFSNNEEIPRKYTCDGSNVSVPLTWTHAPEGTKSFALIADDPDAPGGTWAHWVLYNLPPDAGEILEDIEPLATLHNGAMHGKNDFGHIGYGGPCPPKGPAHRYFFKLYALDRTIGLKPRATKLQALDTMKGHVLAEAQLTGTYRRI